MPLWVVRARAREHFIPSAEPRTRAVHFHSQLFFVAGPRGGICEPGHHVSELEILCNFVGFLWLLIVKLLQLNSRLPQSVRLSTSRAGSCRNYQFSPDNKLERKILRSIVSLHQVVRPRLEGIWPSFH